MLSLKSPRSLLSGLSICSLVLAVAGCGNVPSESDKPLTVNLPHTQVKWQSIGNCWAYATLGWVESLILASTGATENFSESYHTYRHYQDQLTNNRWATEVSTGGNWRPSMRLLQKYGVMNEGDFIPGEATTTISNTQKKATDYLNKSLKEGLLKDDRSPATVKAELNAAFGVDIDALAWLVRPASSIVVKTVGGRAITLAEESANWTESYWPKATRTPAAGSLSVADGQSARTQQALLRRVKKALNDGHPVVMNWFVDFNALDSKGIFSAEQIAVKGKNGSQGYHQTVIEDYVVEIPGEIDPLTGQNRIIGEGEASPEDKLLALEKGVIKYFVVKNSWGGDERPGRSSYRSDGVSGYTRLEASYLFSWIQQVSDKDGSFTGYDTALGAFILPRGY